MEIHYDLCFRIEFLTTAPFYGSHPAMVVLKSGKIFRGKKFYENLYIQDSKDVCFHTLFCSHRPKSNNWCDEIQREFSCLHRSKS